MNQPAGSSASANGSADGGAVISAVAVTMKYSPLGATAGGPGSKFTATQHCCPSTAVILTPLVVITEADSQWMDLGLPWDNTSVSGVGVCYAVSTAVVGRSYITQTRLTTMTTPNSAGVFVDDGTNRTAVGPLCYTVPAGFTPSGALTLSLRVVFGSTADRITIGLVSLSGLSE